MGCKGSFCQCKNENTFKYHYLLRFLLCLIVCIRISTPPPPFPLQRRNPLFFVKSLLNMHTLQALLFRHFTSFQEIFSEPQFYNFSSLNPIDLSKRPKFLVKTSYFKFLVMKKKNIFVLLSIFVLFSPATHSLKIW